MRDNNTEIIRTSRECPETIPGEKYYFDSFENGSEFEGKISGRLPAMGWNSWNAFGSQNTEELTKIMADKIVELGLDKLGYKYVVLDDGCYYPERVDGRLTNDKVKFPGGFRHLADYVHSKGLKFGMYNDIGTNLCAGSAVGTCGFEDVDAESYVEWGVDFLKIDNCYYLWDNATFSNAENARFSYAPNIRSIKIRKDAYEKILYAEDGICTGEGLRLVDGYVTGIGTFDGTNVGRTPVGVESGELLFDIDIADEGIYELTVEYATGREEGVGQWLQLAVVSNDETNRFFDELLEETSSTTDFAMSEAISISLTKGINTIRVMNHRRQENVLISYAAMFNALKAVKSDNDILLSICEWGKTQPHNWGYKIGNSWRILNDITFRVGSPENPGFASWTDPGTPSITSQYDKAVVMDEYAGLNRGWNDPDMLVIGMQGVTPVMEATHMAMWCMMNSPLMLGMDLRKVSKGDYIYNIISNEEMIALNQDTLGIQAKRVYCSLEAEEPDEVYITNHDRVDILAKPLANGDLAVSFINLSERAVKGQEISIERIVSFIGNKMVNADDYGKAESFKIKDLWTGEESILSGRTIAADEIEAFGNVTYRLSIN